MLLGVFLNKGTKGKFIFWHIVFLCINTHPPTHWNIIQPKKKKEILSIATTWMKLEGNILGEISHKDPQILHLTIYMWNLKKEKTKLNS